MTPHADEINIEDLLHQALDFMSVARLALGSQWVGADDLMSIAVVLQRAEESVTAALVEVQQAG